MPSSTASKLPPVLGKINEHCLPSRFARHTVTPRNIVDAGDSAREVVDTEADQPSE
jgi:hypothetical protein